MFDAKLDKIWPFWSQRSGAGRTKWQVLMMLVGSRFGQELRRYIEVRCMFGQGHLAEGIFFFFELWLSMKSAGFFFFFFKSGPWQIPKKESSGSTKELV